MAASEPSVSLLSREDNKWRKDLIFQLQERNKRQTYCFADLISLRKISFVIVINIISIINLSDITVSYCYYLYFNLCPNMFIMQGEI